MKSITITEYHTEDKGYVYVVYHGESEPRAFGDMEHALDFAGTQFSGTRRLNSPINPKNG